jgi:hypothetical protein
VGSRRRSFALSHLCPLTARALPLLSSSCVLVPASRWRGRATHTRTHWCWHAARSYMCQTVSLPPQHMMHVCSLQQQDCGAPPAAPATATALHRCCSRQQRATHMQQRATGSAAQRTTPPHCCLNNACPNKAHTKRASPKPNKTSKQGPAKTGLVSKLNQTCPNHGCGLNNACRLTCRDCQSAASYEQLPVYCLIRARFFLRSFLSAHAHIKPSLFAALPAHSASRASVSACITSRLLVYRSPNRIRLRMQFMTSP